MTVTTTLTTALLAALAAVALVVACASRYPARPAIIGLAALATMVVLPAVSLSRSDDVEVHFLDVGQGDAILIRTNGGHWVLLDAGPAWRGGDAGRTTVLPYILRRGGSLEAFVLSHPHTDHVGGAASVLTAMRPRAYWDAAFAGGSDAYIASLAAAKKEGIAWHRVHPGDSILIDGVSVSFLAPDSVWTVGLKDPNLASTIALVRYGMVRFLLVGDAERAEEDWLLARHRTELGADVLKVGHHGSGNATPKAAAEMMGTQGHKFAAMCSTQAGVYGTENPDDPTKGTEVPRGPLLAKLASESALVRSDQIAITVAGKQIPAKAPAALPTPPPGSRFTPGTLWVDCYL